MTAADKDGGTDKSSFWSGAAFWQAAMIAAPIAAAVLTMFVAQLLGAYDDFGWIDQPVHFIQGIGGLGPLFFPAAAFLVARSRWNAARARASRSWPTVPGTVTASRVTSLPSGLIWPFTLYRLRLTYRYTVDGFEYEGGRVQFGPKTIPSQDLIDAFAAKYPAGASVAVHYDPNDPQTCTIETSDDMVWEDKARIWNLALFPFVLSGLAVVGNALHGA